MQAVRGPHDVAHLAQWLGLIHLWRLQTYRVLMGRFAITINK